MKRFLAAALAIALIVTGLYPTQLVKAASSAEDGGLNFFKEYKGQFRTAEAQTTLPTTFEATVLVDPSEEVWRPGYIASNTDCSWAKSKGNGYAIGFGKGCVPQITFVQDGTVTERNFLRAEDHEYEDASYATTFQNGEWHHITVVNDVTNDEIRWYSNGQLFATLEGAYKDEMNATNPFSVGGDYREDNHLNFKGNIKNVAIYSDIRTDEEIYADYERAKTELPSTISEDDGLLGAYNFGLTSEGLFPREVADLSANGKTLTNTNCVKQNVPTAQKYEGLNFWTTKYGYFTEEPKKNTSLPDYLIPETFEATVRIGVDTNGDVAPHGGTIIGTYNGLREGGYGFGFNENNRPHFFVTTADGTTEYYEFINESETEHTFNHIFRLAAWAHLAIVIDRTNTQMHCYVNGELYATLDQVPSVTVCTAPYSIGGDYRKDNTENFKGEIRDVAIYSDARTADEVKSDYTNGVTGSEEGLLAAYYLEITLDPNNRYPTYLKDKGPNNIDLWRLLSEDEAKELSGRDEYDFSMAVVGDPQVVTAWTAQGGIAYEESGDVNKIFDWIVANKESRKIQWTFNLGDTTDSYAPNNSEAAEWAAGAAAVKKLDGNVPYSIVRGNHDATDYYNQYFSWDDYGSTVAGSYEENMLNTYQTFEVSGIKYMVLNLDFGVAAAADGDKGDKIIAWANDVVAAHPDHKVIITTHAYLHADGTRLNGAQDANGGLTTSYYARAKSGEDMWNELVSLHENVIMVISGHVEADAVVKRESIGVNGNKVIELLVNPQETDVRWADRGRPMTGAVAMLYFSNGGKDVNVEYYSTIRDGYYNRCDRGSSQFSFSFDIEDDAVVHNEDGSMAVPYSQVDTSGDVPTMVGGNEPGYNFAGWFTSTECELKNAITDAANVTESCYAKFVSEDILNIKAQVSTTTISSGDRAGMWAMRFVSSIDSLAYKKIGFKVTYQDDAGVTQTVSTNSNKVYEKIASAEAEADYGFSPMAISEKAAWAFTTKVAVADTEAAKAREYTVQSFYETLDGTIIYGPARIVSANDGLSNNVINLTVQTDTQLAAGKYWASYGLVGVEKRTGTVRLVSSDASGYSTFRITMPENLDDLPSASNVVIWNEDDQRVAKVIHRNYNTSHDTGDGTGVAHADTSWFWTDPGQMTFKLGSSADLYGFNELIGKGYLFSGRTVALIHDITINEGTAIPFDGTTAPSWQDDDGVIFKWEDKGGNWGSVDNAFSGTFDGNGNTISGLYINDTSNCVGFFGSVSRNATVCNLGIVNSYIQGGGENTGAIVGYSFAQSLDNLYSDAVVVGGKAIGGIVGNVQAELAGLAEHQITKCWFDGQVYISGEGYTSGGIAGQIYDSVSGNFRFADCLFSGELHDRGTYSWPNAGGVLGDATSGSPTVAMENCISVGTMSSSHSTGGFGGTGGYLPNLSSSSTIKNCYSLSGQVYSYNFSTAGSATLTASGTTDGASLSFATEEALLEKLPLLTGQEESPWMCNVSGDVAGTPILEEFSAVWLKKQQ